jgi:protein-tyrosine phosphatase
MLLELWRQPATTDQMTDSVLLPVTLCERGFFTKNTAEGGTAHGRCATTLRPVAHHPAATHTMRILMVCLGNICRSPLAEGIMQKKALEAGLDWTVDSAGTGHWHVGSPPDHRSVATARKHGLDIGEQRGRQFQVLDFQRFDQIFVMDAQNLRDVLRLAADEAQRAKVSLILDETNPGQARNVPDPYYDDDGFEAVFEMLDEACAAFVRKAQPQS